MLKSTVSSFPARASVVRGARGARGSASLVVRAEPASVGEVQEPVTLPTKLNTTPHERETRQYFYDMATTGMLNALKDGKRRLQLRMTIPELNPEMDVYRVGTLLEMVREMATGLAQDGKKTKVCVQGSLGQGVFQGLPLALSGVRRILERMDWGDLADFVSFGAVGADQVDDADYYIIVSPQNVVGTSIIPYLAEMVEAVEAKGKAIILVNPNLKDRQSSGGVMGVRGRKDRMDFANSFDYCCHFRLLYAAGTFFPIWGALKFSYGGKWEVYDRVDYKIDMPDGSKLKTERYELVGTFEEEPGGGDITECFRSSMRY